MRKCQGKNKAGNPCGKWALKGRDYCRNHGGKNARGPAHHNYKTGEYSKDVPGHLLALYGRAMEDPDLATNRRNIAINEALVWELLGQMDESGIVVAAQRIRSTLHEYQQAMEAKDLQRMATAWGEHVAAVEAGAEYETMRADLVALMEAGRRMRETEARVVKTATEVIRADEMMALLSFTTELLAEVVTDRKQLQSFRDRLYARIGRTELAPGEILA